MTRKFLTLLMLLVMTILPCAPPGHATMTQTPPDGYMGNASRTTAQMQQAFEDVSSVLMELLGGHSESSAVTLSGNAFSPVVDYCVYPLLPSSGTTDNLKTIDATSVRDGAVIILRNSNAANTITVQDSTGNLHLADGANYAINNTGDYIAFVYRGSAWYEVWRTGANIIKVLPGAKSEATVTEDASNRIVPTQAQHSVDTNAAASAQNLDGASSAFTGNELTLRAVNASHVVTIRNNQTPGTGYYPFLTSDGNSAVLDSTTKFIEFFKDTGASAWREFRRSGFSSSTSWTIVSSSGSFTMNGASLSLYKVDTSGGAATATLQTSPADGRIYKIYATSASNSITLQTTGGQSLYLPDGTTATSLTITNASGVCELIAVTGGYLLT